MKKNTIYFLIALFFLGLGLSSIQVQATETFTGETYAISILKYKISETSVLSKELPLNGTKVEEVTDEDGNALDPLPGISYEIIRVSPVQGESTFAPVEGNDSFSITVTTDQTGLARVDGLASGTYQVIEKENSVLKTVMDPVIVELPLPQREGDALKEVYLYPKSSVIDSNPTEQSKNSIAGANGVTGGNTAGTPTASGKLPQTSGNIGNAQSLYLILAFIIMMGVIGVKVLRIKHHKF